MECALALGFESMSLGFLTSQFEDRVGPNALCGLRTFELEETLGENFGPVAPRLSSSTAKEGTKYGANIGHFSKIGALRIPWMVSLCGAC